MSGTLTDPRVTAAPTTGPNVLMGAASPLWGYYAGAAMTGVAFWMMTRWTRPMNRESMFAVREAPQPVLEAVSEVVAEGASAAEAMAEPVIAPAVEAVAEVEVPPVPKAVPAVPEQVPAVPKAMVSKPKPAAAAKAAPEPTLKSAAKPAGKPPQKGAKKSKPRAN